jgi:hypothetical protein
MSLKSNPTVSILTLTQFNRFSCLNILLELIKKQTYNNIIEWVIVEGTKNEEEVELNKVNIKNMIETNKVKFNIKYVLDDKEKKIGYLRNIGSKACIGDITVCMDDDDFYPKSRVEHAVISLIKSNYLIAGCDNLLIYDFSINKIYQFDGIPNRFHSGNASMAWKKEYLNKHSYRDIDEKAEEDFFTNGFTEPMVKLNPFLTIIALSHSQNTIGKKKLFISTFINDKGPYWNEVSININKFIDFNIFNKYKDALYTQKDIDYDIIYYCGFGFGLNFVPNSSKNGGSALSVIKLSEGWVKAGKKVAVFAETTKQTLNGVDYYGWEDFPHLQKHKIVILWKEQGIIGYKMFGIKADKLYIDFHNNFINANVPKKVFSIVKDNYDNFDKIFVKSNYQKEYLSKHIKDDSKIYIILDGISVEEFSCNKYNVERNPFRFCYTSCYNRGMISIVEKLWKIIFKKEPRAELHFYHGYENVSNEDLKFYFRTMLGTPGVMDHGRQDLDMIVAEKYKSSFYFGLNISNDFKNNSVTECYITGCIPILSNHYLYKDLYGYHIDFEDNKSYEFIANEILELVYDTKKQEELRKKNYNSPLINSWDIVIQEWLKYLE